MCTLFFCLLKLYFSITVLAEIHSYGLIEYNLTHFNTICTKNLVHGLLKKKKDFAVCFSIY